MSTVPGVGCPFCERISAYRAVAENGLAAALLDRFPVSPGHILVVPKRHEADFLALTAQEHAAIMELVQCVRHRMVWVHGPTPDGYNIGVNVGGAAGQTVGHAHLHLIPRYKGDVDDPRGGVRWVVPSKAKYWKD